MAAAERPTVAEADPVVTVWRNRIPRRCTLMYWGRKWGLHKGGIHRINLWTVHAPVNGGETLTFDTRHMKRGTVHRFECYQLDGSPIRITGPAEAPDA